MKIKLMNLSDSWRSARPAIKNVAARTMLVCATGVFVLISGCATGPHANPADPMEPFNRGVATFNDGLDRAVLKPVATAYAAITPSFVRAGVTNFFGNLQDGWSFVNSAAQLRPPQAADSLMRFSVNTVFGLGGVLDIATEAGIEKHNEDLGKTLGRWGMPSGPYVVLPVFGPSTLRDAFTITAETKYDPISQLDHAGTRNGLTVVRIVNTRANYLRLGNLLDDAALDKYSFTRDAFLAKRNAEVARAISNGKDDDADTAPNDSEKKAK
jgi:phospholipid-binding lipoprotein MlaA